MNKEAIIAFLTQQIATYQQEQRDLEKEHSDEDRDVDAWQEGNDEGYASGAIQMATKTLNFIQTLDL